MEEEAAEERRRELERFRSGLVGLEHRSTVDAELTTAVDRSAESLKAEGTMLVGVAGDAAVAERIAVTAAESTVDSEDRRKTWTGAEEGKLVVDPDTDSARAIPEDTERTALGTTTAAAAAAFAAPRIASKLLDRSRLAGRPLLAVDPARRR